MKINLKTYFRLLRKKDARGYFLMAAFGFILSKGFLFPLQDILLFWAIIFLLLGFGFSINDCFDLREDRLDPTKKNPIVLGQISLKKALVFSISLAILGLFLSSLFGLRVFLFCLITTLISLFYSSPPLRLKSRFLLDLISHGLFAGSLIFFLPLMILKTQLTLFYYLIAFSLFCFSIILELRNQTEEYQSDKLAGLKNTTLILGKEKSEKLLKILSTFYPLTLFPIFNLFSNQYFLLFLVQTSIFLFLFLFFQNQKFVKNYKLIDAYVILSLGLLLIATR